MQLSVLLFLFELLDQHIGHITDVQKEETGKKDVDKVVSALILHLEKLVIGNECQYQNGVDIQLLFHPFLI